LAFGQYEALTRRHEFILWLALLGLAALLRFGSVPAGLPYITYVDEGHVLHPSIEILKARSFDTGRFTYPPLTSYLTTIAAKAYSPIYRLVHHHTLGQDLPRDEDYHTGLGENYDLITPPEIILLGRLVVACLSLGTVVLAGVMAKQFAGARAGLLAMVFVALCPALVSRGSIAIIDTTAAFFAAATLYFCQRLRTQARWSDAALAGIAAGLAAAGKYTVGVVFISVCITIAMLQIASRSKALLGLASIGGLVAGILGGVPAALLHPAKIIAELRAQAAFYQTIRSDQPYWAVALSGSEIGILLALAALFGLALMLRNRATRGAAIAWLGFGILLLSVVAWPSFQPFRNLLSLVPLVCIAAAFFFEQIWLHLEHRGMSRRLLAATLALLLFTIPLAWFSGLYLEGRLKHVDSRVLAIDWLRQHVSKEETILGIREIAILPTEWQRISAKVTVVSWFQAADLLERQRFDYVVAGEFDLRYATDAALWSAYRDRWTKVVSNMPMEANFGVVSTPVIPYLWRTNDQLVVIRRGTPR